MRLTSGDRLGPYEIQSAIGAGGMGEVYRARDSRLDRPVAIKLLSGAVADSPEGRQRFQVEARAISSLQHPHICTLFDVGEERGHLFLVMEYLEGETLDDRLTRGPLPTRELLLYASQIASALDHAHRARIVHRDLKPSNVMLTESGAKLLDFGLARTTVLGDGTTASTVSFAPDKLTAEGTIVGTFQYMAPEQVEGKAADDRTDIFAFGALLFEMATGRRAFEGESQASLIASIMTAHPPTLSSTRAQCRVDGVPAALDHLVERCLAKDPDERWQTARDLKAELAWIVEGRSSSTRLVPVASRRRVREGIAWSAAVVAGLVAVAGFLLGRSEQPADVMRFTVPLPVGSSMTRVRGDATFLALSPDGRHMVFVASTEGQDTLWVHSFDSATPRALFSGQTVMSPFWSPDSRFIGFFAPGEGALKKVEVTGGPTRTICAARSSGLPLWMSDGTILFTEFRQGLFRVSADGGQPTQVTRVDQALREINHYWPSALPDGRHFLYMTTRLDESGRRATPIVYVASFDSKERKEIARVHSRMVYTRPGRVLYVHEASVLAQAFDVTNLRLTGEPIRLADGIEYNRSTGASMFSVSDNGTLIYKVGIDPLELVWFDRSGKELGSLGTPQRTGNLRISPEGDRVAVEVTDPRLGTSDIWVYELARNVGTRLTTDLNDERLPTWAPDGRRIAFVSDRGTGSDASGDFFVKRADGMGEEDAFFVQVGPQFLEDWSRDDRSIAYRDETREAGDNVWILPLQAEKKPLPFMRTRFEEWGARFSPDSAWVAFVSNESGTSEVYVAPVQGAGAKLRISVGGGIAPRWRRDGKELFYLSSDGKVVMSVPITLTPSMTSGAPVPLFTIPRDTDLQGRLRNMVYDVTPDGGRFLFSVALREASLARLSVVTNWPRLLE
jgi:serine/threonine protein kinase/Tol biopolymer transport system component